MEITEVILHDHHEQRRLFAAVEDIDPSNARALASVWKRLQILLEVHAKAEEVLFYPRLVKLQHDLIEASSPDAQTEDAIHDHNEIRDAIAGVGHHEPGSMEWLRAVAEVNKVNGDHMAEEEREGLADFRRHVGLAERHDLAIAFTVFEAEHVGGIAPQDENPQEYVAAHD